LNNISSRLKNVVNIVIVMDIDEADTFVYRSRHWSHCLCRGPAAGGGRSSDHYHLLVQVINQ